MFAAYADLVTLAFRSVAWLAETSAIFGFILGVVVAFLCVDGVNRALLRRPQSPGLRRLASAASVFWGLSLPICFGLAGLTWGLGRGVSNLVEGPASSAVRAAVLPWMKGAAEISNKWGPRWTLAQRLSERELTLVTQKGPRWLAEVLFPSDRSPDWLHAVGISVPPGLVVVARETLQQGPQKYASWFAPTLDPLRARTQGEKEQHPTFQETLEAMIAPSVFRNAAHAIRKRSLVDAGIVAGGALLASALFAGLFVVFWRRGAGKTSAGGSSVMSSEPRVGPAQLDPPAPSAL